MTPYLKIDIFLDSYRLQYPITGDVDNSNDSP